MMPTFDLPVWTICGAGTRVRAVSNLRAEPLHEVLVVFRALGVESLLVVAAAAGEVGGFGVVGAGQSAIRDGVAIDVFVAAELAEALEVVGGENLAAVEGLVRIGERVGHPVVHAEVEVGEDEDRGLQLLGEIEGGAGELVALHDTAGQKHDVLRVAVREDGDGEQIGLRGARGQASGGADALDIKDDAGELSEVAEAGELGHERDAGAGGGGHGAGACPAGAEDHANRGEFVFRLDDGETGFAVGLDAVLLEVIDELLDDRRGRA